MIQRDIVKSGHSRLADARAAVAEFHAAVAQQDPALVVFFCSSAYDLAELADEMKRRFGAAQVVGCTTAGEIGPAGCRDHSLAGVSFSSDAFAAVSGRLGPLSTFDSEAGTSLVDELQQRLHPAAPADAGRFGLLLIDGLSVREELVTRTLQAALGDVPLVGGSAGDDLAFRRTHVYADGAFHADSALLVLMACALPFRVFKSQHFIATEQRAVVTDADATRRVVREIDGYPAAEAYARMLGVRRDDLGPMVFAEAPVVAVIAGTNYVRSIRCADPDGSLEFLSAIETGMVLRLARGTDLVEDLERIFGGIRRDIGPPSCVLAFDCVLRKLEVADRGLGERVDALLRRNRAVGFNTYGEQCHGLHVNQTLVGVAIGAAA